MDTISVIIPCRNEEKYIAGCLESVVNNNYPIGYIEIFIVDGNSNDNTIEIVKSYISKFNYIHLLMNKEQTVPYALNTAIKKSTGKYIVRLDAHSAIPKNYFSELIKWSKELNADNLGARCLTDVKNKNPKSLSIRKVLISKFGVGNSYFRIGTENIKEVDTVPFGCYKKEVFNRIGLFDTRLIRNQDIELNKRLKRNGGKIYLLPDLFCTYYARESFFEFAKNNFQTGLWNILTIYYTRHISSVSLRHLIPLGFILSLTFPLFAIIWNPLSGFVSLLFFSLYLLIIGIVSMKIKSNDSSFYFVFLSFLVLHFSYGLGSFLGIFKLNSLFKKQYE